MKKSLLALAVLGAVAGQAAAQQSAVTLYGVLDLSLRHTDNGVSTLKSVSPNGLSSSRWGLRGSEAISKDLSAEFTLESGINGDTGNSGSGASLFNRRATVSLVSKSMGELRLGRDKTPVYVLLETFDPFGAGGAVMGSVQNFGANLAGQDTFQRADNSTQYFLPGNMGGFYGSVGVSLGEGVSGKKLMGTRLGYKAGPVNVGFAHSRTTVTKVSNKDQVKETALGVSYNFGPATVHGLYNDRKSPALVSVNASGENTQKTMMVGLAAGVGKDGSARLSYTSLSNNSVAVDNAKQIALGYTHNLSKRTAVYTDFVNISNDIAARYKVNGEGMAAVVGKSYRGIDVGVRHNF
jgi:predicted porin